MTTPRSKQQPNSTPPPSAAAVDFFSMAWPGTSMAASAILASAHAMRANLTAWRNAVDAARAQMRQQQDAMIAAFEAQLASAASATRGAKPNADGNIFLAASDAYKQANSTFWDAQREALKAMRWPQNPH
jgi:hypothetical protein